MSKDAKSQAAGEKSMIEMTTQVVSAYLSNNSVASSQIGEVINSVHDALSTLAIAAAAPPPERQKPAVAVRNSVKPEYIVCLEDGKHLKMLKRHLRTTYNMTPEEYRTKWSLPADYPMVAPNYAKQRSDFAKKIGLGRKAVRRGRPRRKAS